MTRRNGLDWRSIGEPPTEPPADDYDEDEEQRREREREEDHADYLESIRGGDPREADEAADRWERDYWASIDRRTR